MSGVQVVADRIAEDMKARLPNQRVTQRRKLSLLVAALLSRRDVNLMELGAVLPLESDNPNSRYQWVKRVLKNDLIVPDEVMAPYAREVLAKACEGGKQPVLVIDQSQATRLHRHEMLMVAVRIDGRALPLAWRVKKTSGAIGFSVQRDLLAVVASWLPDGVSPVLMGDRFYATPQLISWCAAKGWSWRLRLKNNLLVHDAEGGEATLQHCFEAGEWLMENVALTEAKVKTHVAMVHDAGHEEPWMIAMSEAPSSARAFDYGLRWGIESMFSDLKSRGFDLEKSQLRLADRIERLILVLALALYLATSTGMWDRTKNPSTLEKKRQTGQNVMPDPFVPSSQGACAAS